MKNPRLAHPVKLEGWTALRRDISPWAYRVIVAAGFLSFFFFYMWLSRQEWVSNTFFPRVDALWEAAVTVFSGEDVWVDVQASLLRVTGGFALAAVLALPIGLFMGSYRSVEAFAQPFTEFFRYVPVPALIPLTMIFFGIGEPAKVMLIFIGTFFQMVLMVADEVRRVPYELVQVSYTLGARPKEIVAKVLLRAALPGIFDALRLCNGWAWTYVVVAELVAATEGMGFRILKFYRFIQTPKIFIYLALLGLIGLALDMAFRMAHKRLFAWADTTKR